jgi:hypothetical protein
VNVADALADLVHVVAHLRLRQHLPVLHDMLKTKSR